jgi:hypothetical protein
MNGFKRQFVLTILILASSASLFAVDEMYWQTKSRSVTFANISQRDSYEEKQFTFSRIITTGDCEIGADNSSAACLSFNGNQLTTRYKLSFDGNGTTKTGGDTVNFTAYDTFLSTRAQIRHVTGDDEVQVTLGISVATPAHNVPDAGTYTATQTLTVYWRGL